MTGFLTEPSHYLNQCWLIIKCVPVAPGCNLTVSNLTVSAQTNILYDKFEYHTLRGHWLNTILNWHGILNWILFIQRQYSNFHRFVPDGFVDRRKTLVLRMIWRRIGDNPQLQPMMAKFTVESWWRHAMETLPAVQTFMRRIPPQMASNAEL